MDAQDYSFEKLPDILRPDKVPLWLHQPKWEIFQKPFLKALISVHQRLSKINGTMYISLQDVRDEVCRQLRLSSLRFDQFLELSIKDLPTNEFPWSIAIETDIRENQRSAEGQLRRQVYVNRIPYSLIGLAHLR